MIALVRGRLHRKDPAGTVVVDSGPVGYRVFVSLSTLLAMPGEGDEVCLHTVTVVRDDAMHLYGFMDLEEKALFNLLVQVKGIGPRLALALLGGLKPADLRKAIAREDAGWISTVPGVGRKTAERIVLELKDKIAEPAETDLSAPEGVDDQVVNDALSALLNLGYRAPESRAAMRKFLGEAKSPPGLDELIRGSLRLLSGRKG